jgi:hypothetical protein
MANALYPAFKQALLNKEHDLNTDSIKAVLIDLGAYVYNPAHVSFATDVAAGAKIAEVVLTSPTIIDGIFDTADFVWPTVTGVQSEAIILYNDSHPSKGLIAFFDQGITGFPITPNGANINGTVHASGWFAL